MNKGLTTGTEPSKLVEIIPAGARVLWVASTGGHLEQLVRMASNVESDPASSWITFDSHQSKSLLRGRNVVNVPYVKPRDFKAAFHAARIVAPSITKDSYDVCVSTGAALASSILPLARIRGLRTIYVESVSRTEGPSLTGRLMRAFPGISTYTQHRTWAKGGWRQLQSLLEEWKPVSVLPKTGSLKLFVTLGTIKPYRFDRAVDSILSLLRPGDEVVWQLGATTRSDLPGETHSEIPASQVLTTALWADVVITHAGVGSILSLLDVGICPILAVRDRDHNEHVDGHQSQIATAMVSRKLAYRLDLSEPRRDTLYSAAATKIEPQAQ
ncbi:MULTISPECIES: glycosyltransferase [unclassified Rhodococcus (in: high G+C Gram-positive bacteria)]|uniref:glycosyltransferase n=1 Tax=unclassified Rhodococcus (in: high G+C Gram-positive bacteria) TaxID=192944 RepID=UPI0033968772